MPRTADGLPLQSDMISLSRSLHAYRVIVWTTSLRHRVYDTDTDGQLRLARQIARRSVRVWLAARAEPEQDIAGNLLLAATR